MATATPIRVEVDIVVAAPPATVYGLVADVTRMGEWSPETVSAEWVDGAMCAAVGARFKGRNRLGRLRWATKPTVTRADDGVAFEFLVPGRARSRWQYRFESVEDGAATRVIESMTQEHPLPAPIRFLQRRAGVTDRTAHLREGMVTTLQRLSAVATATHDDPNANTNTNTTDTSNTNPTRLDASWNI